MEIQEGRCYAARSGRVFGPLERVRPLAAMAEQVWCWRAAVSASVPQVFDYWTIDGRWFEHYADSAMDLIEEIQPNEALS